MIVTGSVTDLQSSIAVNCRLVDVSSARVVGAAEARIVKDDDLRAILGKPLVGAGAQSTAIRPNSSMPMGDQSAQARTLISVTIEGLGCARLRTTVTCNLSVTNNDRDRDIDFLPARAFDRFGNESETTRVSAAKKSGSEISMVRLISGVPTNASLMFDDFGPDVKELSALYVRAYIRDPTSGISFGTEQFEFRSLAIRSE